MLRARLIASFVIAFSLIANSAYAAPSIAGQSCKTLGASKKVSGTKYQCSKSGKKLVWKKVKSGSSAGTVNKPSTPQNPVVTPSPSAPPAAQTLNSCFKAVPVKYALEDFAVCDVMMKAIKELENFSTANQNKVANVKLHKTSPISDVWINEEIARLNVAHSFWYQNFKPEEVVLLYWLNNSQEEYDAANQIYQGYQKAWNGGAPIGGGRKSSCQAATGADFAVYDQQSKKFLSHTYIIQTCAGETQPIKSFKIVHEYTHLVQTEFHVVQNAPVWVTEGGAEYFGEMLGNYKRDPQLLVDWREEKSRFWAATASQISKSSYLDLMKSQTSPGGDPQKAYYFGALINEFLIGVYGFEKYVKFLESYLEAPDSRIGPERVSDVGVFLDNSLKKVYGISMNQLYDRSYDYVTQMAGLIEAGWK